MRARLELATRASERVFNGLVERDEDGFYVSAVVELPGCHTQARTLDKLDRRTREAIEAYLRVAEPEQGPEFIGVHQFKVARFRRGRPPPLGLSATKNRLS